MLLNYDRVGATLIGSGCAVLEAWNTIQTNSTTGNRAASSRPDKLVGIFNEYRYDRQPLKSCAIE